MSEKIKFYMDEHVPTTVTRGLRMRGIDVLTAQETGLLAASDEAHLALATDQGRVLLTQDADFLRLHAAGIAHTGIVYAHQQTQIGAIVTQLHYHTLERKLLAGHDRVATAVVLEQFYKNPDLPAPEGPGVIARAIQLGVKEKAFGLADLVDDQIDPDSLRYGEEVLLEAIPFDATSFLASKERCEALIAHREEEERAEPPEPISSVGGAMTEAGREVAPEEEGEEEPSFEGPAEPRYRRLRLVVGDIPVGKIADVNRGVFMPLKQARGEFQFKMEIDVSGEEGAGAAAGR